VTKTTLIYETQTCSRCLGSGHHSFNLRDGTICYGCRGRKVQHTRAGTKAIEAVRAFIAARHTVPVEAVLAGDRVRVTRLGGSIVTRTVVATERTPNSFGRRESGSDETVWTDGITLTYAKPVPDQFGAYDSTTSPVGSTVLKSVSGADWDEVVAYARTLKKGVTVHEQEVADAAHA